MTIQTRTHRAWNKISISIAVLLSLAFASSATAVSFTLAPATASVAPGEMILLTLVASDLAPSVIGGYDIDVVFDPSVISVVNYTLAGVLGDLTLGEAFDFSGGAATPGILNLTVLSTLDAASLATLQQGQFAIATFSVMIDAAAAGGAHSLSLALNALTDGSGIPIAPNSLSGASLNVIPEPSTALLLSVGLAAMAGRRRERKPLKVTHSMPHIGSDTRG